MATASAASHARRGADSAPVVCFFHETYQPYGVKGEHRALAPADARALANPKDGGAPVVEIVGPPQPRDKSRDMATVPTPGSFSRPDDLRDSVKAMADAIASLTAMVAELAKAKAK